MSNSKEEGEWSTVSRKKDKKTNIYKPNKKSNTKNTKTNTYKPNKKSNTKNTKTIQFYQEDRRWKRDKYFKDKSNRGNIKSTTTDFPKLFGSQTTSTPFTHSGPKWSNLIKKDTDENKNDEDENNKIESHISTRNCLFNTQYKTQYLCVRNQIPKNNYNVSYYSWEISYFKYLIDLYDIFCKGMEELEIPYLDTSEVFEDFCYFIRDSSSGKISAYLDSIDNNASINNLEDSYYEYTIKRNNHYN